VREVQGRRALPALVATSAAIVAVDHLTKWLAQRELRARDVDLVGSLRLHLVYNRGAAFGLGSRFAPIIALVVVGVIVAMIGFGRTVRSPVSRFALAAIIGGAIGNLLDRLLRDGDRFLGGPVVDFIDLQWWPVFNVADIAVVVGAVALALSAGREASP
jgi:signal peptidase II